MTLNMKPVIQEDTTGCAIACSAFISGITYARAKVVAGSLGIDVNDSALWSETDYIRRLLAELDIQIDDKTRVFSDWATLPDCSLLAIKWHLEKGKPCWHWVVFVRENDWAFVLDPKKGLKSNIRTDFGRIKPKWFLEVY